LSRDSDPVFSSDGNTVTFVAQYEFEVDVPWTDDFDVTGPPTGDCALLIVPSRHQGMAVRSGLESSGLRQSAERRRVRFGMREIRARCQLAEDRLG